MHVMLPTSDEIESAARLVYRHMPPTPQYRWPLLCEHAEVTDDEIAQAMAIVFESTHNCAEGAGAASFAAIRKERHRLAGRKVAAVLSGGNIDRQDFANVLARYES